ncbi:hypothetical protein [Fibrella aquatilis]|uniref:Uncharacterized protein n=1 Tax=Fibrella aquatilis TaxID=2817059 RepID=A0A939G3R6_9BACT|nr:hypothetical protein [Fibrella aquatilis]MBO0931812.1 hypothetical protein [Fibrella aquatilis]
MLPVLPLKSVLLVNAISSAATGVLLVFLANPIADLFGVPQTNPFNQAGIFLLVFAGLVFITSLQQPINVNALRFIILLDALWVIASLVLLLFLGSSISTIGIVAILAVAAWVAMMALLQRIGLRSL